MEGTKKHSRTYYIRLFNLILIVIGIVFGELIASLVSGVSFLRWLSFGLDFGLTEPFAIDLALIKVSFGFFLDIKIADIIFAMLSLLVGRVFVR